ncbi:hypothetical protein N8I71_08370 [Roseibacterium sp. SDUM158016]|jgi:hypothetical protein|uniref:hypothetical protein n=1 Tax=Roseicyclus sediminis TaxID=2980997 RepID=UPI0021D2D536|nr:hypothetical protein [Roseibacterium sp. SDUM158016]MCU4652844.1 hypothetical protein [Roseibacterium sp. SDUM158016]
MPHQMKIATCSYCGRRQTLRLTARDGHELACGACGAPLHEMKWLKAGRDEDTVKRSPRRPAPHGHALPQSEGPASDPPERRRKKRRKGFFREALEEAFDIFEDIFD